MGNKVKITKSAGGVVVNKDGKILVVNQDGVTWSLPKGHIENGENGLDSAEREIYEESGIKNLELIKKLGDYERYKLTKDGNDDETELKMISIFLFRTSENILKPIDPANPQAKWVDKDKVADLLTHPKDKNFFSRIMKEI